MGAVVRLVSGREQPSNAPSEPDRSNLLQRPSDRWRENGSSRFKSVAIIAVFKLQVASRKRQVASGPIFTCSL